MKLIFVLSCILLVAFNVILAEECRKKEKMLASSGECNFYSRNVCRDMCTGVAILPTDCVNKKYCCLNSNKLCVLRQVKAENLTTDSKPELMRFLITNFLENFAQARTTPSRGESSSGGSASSVDTQSRNFQIGSGRFPPIFSSNVSPVTFCPSFPQNCPIELIQSEDLNAPVNIPYCQRIACSPSNPFLESDFKACVSQPGCFYDRELSVYRNLVGQAILPQGPVCQLVIRNRAFQKRAREVIQQNGGVWNPLLTQCLLREYNEEIFGDAVGCQLLDYLEYFGHRAKLAGWPSINRKDCLYIGACWRSSGSKSYCAYPASSRGQPTVRSSNDRDENRFGNGDNYGQPTCSHFNPSASGREFLDSYHACLSAGCAVSVDRRAVWQQLTNVGSHLQIPVKLRYIAMIYAGKVRPDNFQSVIKQFQDFPLSSFVESNLPSLDLANILLRFQNQANNSRSLQLLSRITDSRNKDGIGASNLRNLLPYLPVTGGSMLPFISYTGIDLIGNEEFPFQTGFLNPTNYNPCPYQQEISYPGLPLLSGNFEGCCEQPLCYTPKSKLYAPYSGISSYLYHWSNWSRCSKSCGGGFKNRSRICIGDKCDPSTILLQTQICNEQECPYFLHWGKWSDCSASCGGGYRFRIRECKGSTLCIGEARESEACETGECPSYKYSHWSTCSNTCGRGTRTRGRRCLSDGAYGCLPDAIDEGPCEQFCGTSSTRCNLETCCYQQICLRANGSPGYCLPDNKHGLACRAGFCWFKRSAQLCRPSNFAFNFFS